MKNVIVDGEDFIFLASPTQFSAKKWPSYQRLCGNVMLLNLRCHYISFLSFSGVRCIPINWRCQHTTLQRGKYNKNLFASFRSAVFILISESLVFAQNMHSISSSREFLKAIILLLLFGLFCSQIYIFWSVVSIEIRN